MKRQEKLRDALEPDISNVRLNRQWIAIKEETNRRNERSAVPGWVFGVAVATLVALTVVAIVVQQMSLSSDQTTATKTNAVQLADGSTVTPVGTASFAVAVNEEKEVLVELEEGEARFDVTHDRERDFEVRAGDVRVVVVGTRFSVTNHPDQGGRVSVTVREGVVDVYTTSKEQPIARLTAGSHWTTTTPQRASLIPPRSDFVEHGLESVAQETRSLLQDMIRHPIERPQLKSGPPRNTRHHAKTDRPETQPDSTAALFERGRVARRTGRYRAAARAFSQLLDDYPDDRRAGLAAFELGRLRADKLGDHRGAVKALEIAIKAPNNSAYREDAMARRVDSYFELGNKVRCETSRQAYLTVYPNGVHASMLPDCSRL